MDHCCAASSISTASAEVVTPASASSVAFVRGRDERGRPGRGAHGESVRERQEVCAGKAAPRESGRHCLVTGERVAAQHERGRALPADAFTQPPQVTATGMDPDVEEARVEARVRRREHDVAGQGQVDARADRRAGDHRDGRDGRGRDAQEPGVRAAQVDVRPIEIVERTARGEHRWRRGEEDRSRAGFQRGVDRGREVVAHATRERVAMVRIVEGEHGHAVLVHLVSHQRTGRAHPAIVYCVRESSIRSGEANVCTS